MPSRATFLVVSVAVCLAAQAVWADLDAAKRLYEQARAEKDPARQAELLRQSLAAEETYEAQVALGEAMHALGDYGAARTALERALELAGTEKAKARVFYVLGETHLSQGQRQEALALLRRSLQHASHPAVLDRLKAVELEMAREPASSAEIKRALAGDATRAFGVKPSVTLRIGFALGSAELDAAGRKQAQELGNALLDAALADKNFVIVGHTDKQGDAALNDRLSLRRAEAVRTFLVAEFGLRGDRLRAVGRGERELLYSGDSEQDHALNRRVEVVIPR